MNLQDMLTDLKEVRAEITRLNKAAGLIVFNPAATEILDEVINTIKDEIAENKG